MLVEHPGSIRQRPLFRLETIQLFHFLDRPPLQLQVERLRGFTLHDFRLQVFFTHPCHDIQDLLFRQILVILVITGHHHDLARIRGPRVYPLVHIPGRDLQQSLFQQLKLLFLFEERHPAQEMSLEHIHVIQVTLFLHGTLHLLQLLEKSLLHPFHLGIREPETTNPFPFRPHLLESLGILIFVRNHV